MKKKIKIKNNTGFYMHAKTLFQMSEELKTNFNIKGTFLSYIKYYSFTKNQAHSIVFF